MAASLPAGAAAAPASAAASADASIGHDRGSTVGAGPHALQAVDDDQVAGGDAAAHDAQAVDERAERARCGTRLV